MVSGASASQKGISCENTRLLLGTETSSVERPSSPGPVYPLTRSLHLKAGDPLDKFLDDFPSVSREQAEAFLDLAQVIVEEAADARYRG
jgi:hypothetical protein